MGLPLVLLASAFLILVKWLMSDSRKRPPLPPGPPPDPLIGHLRVVPPKGQDVFFYELGKIYGDVLYFNIMGRPIIVLNSVQAAIDLFDKRSVNYSDRPNFPISEIMGYVKSVPFMKYGNNFRLHRRMYQQYFGKNDCIAFRPSHITEARVLARNLVSDPKRREDHLIRFSTTIIMRAAYGHQIISDTDPYLKISQDICTVVANAGPPGGTPIDIFPFLRHFPSWFPGTYYAQYARSKRALVVEQYTYPYTQVKKQMSEGTAKSSFMATQLERLSREGAETDDMIEHIQGASATIFTAGAETTSSTLSFFFLAMVLHPECQAKAQEEIDRVIGPDRLPEFSDRTSLPYVESLVQETLRWMPAVPMGIPHRALSDDIYNGMFIPQGSTVIANMRAMALDESIYSDPSKFDPARFLPQPAGRGEPHPVGQFGFGRRICPGRHFANDSVWIAIATILSTLSISKTVGRDGKESTPGLQTVTGITCHPSPFECAIEHRSEMAESLLAQTGLSSASE